jgi:hypothetical protein
MLLGAIMASVAAGCSAKGATTVPANASEVSVTVQFESCIQASGALMTEMAADGPTGAAVLWGQFTNTFQSCPSPETAGVQASGSAAACGWATSQRNQALAAILSGSAQTRLVNGQIVTTRPANTLASVAGADLAGAIAKFNTAAHCQ